MAVAVYLLIFLAVFVAILEYSGFGQETHSGLLAACLCMSSSSVAMKMVEDNKHTNHSYSRLVRDWSMIYDLAMALMLCLPSAIERGFWGIFVIAKELVFLLIMVSVLLYLAMTVLPSVLKVFAVSEKKELFLLSLMSLCLGAATFTKHLGLTTELGSFFCGLLLTGTPYVKDAINKVDPIKDVFASLYFASVGLILNPVFFIEHWKLLLFVYTMVFLAKFVMFFFFLSGSSQSAEDALLASLCFAQICEFTVLVVGQSFQRGLVTRFAYLNLLALMVISLLATPLIYKAVLSIFPQLTNKGLLEADVEMDIDPSTPRPKSGKGERQILNFTPPRDHRRRRD